MADQLRLGIVGAGGIVKERHLPGFRDVAGVEVVAVANRTHESGAAVAAEWGIPEVMDDWRDLVARPDLDAIVIGTWPYLHRDITSAALMAGKHVFCQARMTMNLADARHMYELSQLTDRVTAICPPPTTMPVDKLVRGLLDDGYLGELRHVRLTALNSAGADADAPPTWRQIAAYSGLNAMHVGIWAEILNKWCGRCREVWANNRCWVNERPNPTGGTYHVSIPDSVTVLSTFENGAQGVFQWSAVALHAPAESIELYGSEGTIVYQPGWHHVMAGRCGEAELRRLPVAEAQRNEWTVERNFIAAIRDGEPVQTSFYDGLCYMELLEAIHRAQQTGQVVRLPLTT